MANLKKGDYMSKENLKMAFDFFDENKDGSISLAELKRVFDGIQEETLIVSVIKESDMNGDGQVVCE